MRIRKILYPTDFSAGSEAALPWASSLARDNNAKLVIVHVREPNVAPSVGLVAVPRELPTVQQDDVRRLLAETKPSQEGVEVDRQIIEGTPGEAIVAAAKQDDAVDLIVMGTHGSTGLTRLLVGSVAEAVVRDAPCPVMTIKQPNMEPAQLSNTST